MCVTSTCARGTWRLASRAVASEVPAAVPPPPPPHPADRSSAIGPIDPPSKLELGTERKHLRMVALHFSIGFANDPVTVGGVWRGRQPTPARTVRISNTDCG